MNKWTGNNYIYIYLTSLHDQVQRKEKDRGTTKLERLCMCGSVAGQRQGREQRSAEQGGGEQQQQKKSTSRVGQRKTHVCATVCVCVNRI
jgi:hypothetical protein